MAKYKDVTGRPAGFSSSEDEWEMDNEKEEEEEPTGLSFKLQKSSDHIGSDSMIRFKTSETSQKEFVWTKNSCARRSDATKKGLLPPHPQHAASAAAAASPAPDKNELDFDPSKCRPDFAEGRVQVKTDWVEKKLTEAVTDSEVRSTVPRGSPEVDEYWLATISQTWIKKTRNDSTFPAVVMRCLSDVPNPYTTSLHIMENFHNHITGKKPQILNGFLNLLNGWLIENSVHYENCLDEHVQLRAFAFIVRVSAMYSLRLIVHCFKLDSVKNVNDFIAIISHLLARQEYMKASRCIAALSLQDRFSMQEVCLPLLLQGHVGQEIEEYLLGHHDQQIQFVQLLNEFLHQDFNFDFFYGESKVHGIRKDMMEPKRILKLVSRLMQLYQIPEDVCPNVCRMRSKKALHYLIYRKYIHKDIAQEQWEDLIRAAVEGDQFLQLDFINKVIDDFMDFDDAAKVASWFSLPPNLIPSDLTRHMAENMPSRSTSDDRSRCNVDEESTCDDCVEMESDDVCFFHRFILPLESSIHWVDNSDEFLKFLDHLKDSGPTIGFDSEWRPLQAQLYGSRVALLQLAVRDAVYLFDMIALVNRISDESWKRFAEDVLCSNSRLLLAYGFEEDLSILLKAVPLLQQFADRIRILDLAKVHKMIRRQTTTVSGVAPSTSETTSSVVNRRMEERGLSELVKLCLGRPLDKTQQVSDWERRPLRHNQTIYAALDAFCLLEIYDVLKERCAEFQISAEVLSSGGGVSLGKTKLQKKQQRLQNHSPRTMTGNMSSVAVGGQAMTTISPNNFRVVCDTMLTGLGRHLRRCGVDVTLLNDGDSHDVAAEIARKESRIVLTSGLPYFTLRSQLASGQCFNVQAKKVESQVVEVLQQFCVAVTPSDIFSRCQICNGAEYLEVHPEELREAWRRKVGMRTAAATASDGWSEVAMKEGFDHLDLDSLCLANGAPILLDKLPEAKFTEVDVFYVCSNCGKVYWDGAHHKKVGQQLAHIITTTDSGLQCV